MELQTTWRPMHCYLEAVKTVVWLVSQLAGFDKLQRNSLVYKHGQMVYKPVKQFAGVTAYIILAHF